VVGRTESEEILIQLERANLFILPLDETRQWYHYHALFAEAMQHVAKQRYGNETIRSIYRQASSWYERHGMLADAVEASLSAQDFQLAAHQIQQTIRQAQFTEARELHTVRRWLEHLPEPVLREHPELCFLYARVLLFTREHTTIQTLPRIEELLQTAERIWETQANLAKLGEVLAFRGVAALLREEHVQAAASARQALMQLPEDDVAWRSIALNIIAADDLMAGRLNAAYQTLSESLQLCEMTGNPYAARGTMILLSQTHVGRGELHQAAELYRHTLNSAQEDGDLTDQAKALLGLAQLSYEWNALDESQQRAEKALEVGMQIHDETLRVQSTLLLARISLARKQPVPAQQQISEVLASLQSHQLPALYREALTSQARLQLTVGNLEAVQRWVTNRNEVEVMLPLPQSEQEELLIARLLIQQAKTKEAYSIFNRLETSAQEAGRIQIMLELRVVEALAHIADQDIAAEHVLHKVLAFASKEGYQRLFLDEGNVIVTPLQSLLPAMQENPLTTAYLQSLLAAFEQHDQEQKSSNQNLSIKLVEPLTPQEERILILFASGNTKQEIAEKLFISINTVKSHLKRVYQKLAISSRAEARQIARRLDLLQ
jgi:LuxR family maltose regulon positive regulatory protein